MALIKYSNIQCRHAWGYECVNNKCVKTQITAQNQETILALRVCRLYCYDNIGTLWPIPTGNVDFSKNAVMIDANSISFTTNNNFQNDYYEYFDVVVNRFNEMQLKKIPQKYPVKSGGKRLSITVSAESDDMTLDYETHEGYKLIIIENSDEINVTISAKNFFGARHAIETLSQLIVHDDLNHELVILASASIDDEPKFRHRGISMDTSRTFFPLDVLKKTINGLAMTKMNTFHWHIIDSQSFPMEVEKHPDFAKYGAYSRKKVYKSSDIRDIVKFAKSRGIRVIPEFDAPAHVGEGWQTKKHLTTCLHSKPYLDYCW